MRTTTGFKKRIKFLILIFLFSASQIESVSHGEINLIYTADTAAIIPTTYYIPDISAYKGQCKHPVQVQDLKNKSIARICESDYKNCRMQGSCRLRLKNTFVRLNYIHDHKFDVIEAKKDKCEYATGQTINGKRSCLVPYRSIAADPNFCKPGEVLYIPKVAKMKIKIPGTGKVHDGHFVCQDTGGRIKGTKIDFFTGRHSPRDRANVFASIGLSSPKERLSFVRLRQPQLFNYVKL